MNTLSSLVLILTSTQALGEGALIMKDLKRCELCLYVYFATCRQRERLAMVVTGGLLGRCCASSCTAVDAARVETTAQACPVVKHGVHVRDCM